MLLNFYTIWVRGFACQKRLGPKLERGLAKGASKNLDAVRSCSGVVSLKNGSLMTAIKILLYTEYTVMLTDDDDDDDEL